MVKVCFPNGEFSKSSQCCDFMESMWWKRAHFWCRISFLLSSVPLSLWLNRGHPQGAASALYLHDLTTHPSPWGPRFPGEKLSSLAFRCEPSGLSTCGWAAGVTWQGELTVLTCNWDGPQEACAEGRFHFPISWCRVAVASLLMSAGGEICLIKGSA